jgi:hypothetical protein
VTALENRDEMRYIIGTGVMPPNGLSDGIVFFYPLLLTRTVSHEPIEGYDVIRRTSGVKQASQNMVDVSCRVPPLSQGRLFVPKVRVHFWDRRRPPLFFRRTLL